MKIAFSWRKVPQTNAAGVDLPSFLDKDKEKVRSSDDTTAALRQNCDERYDGEDEQKEDEECTRDEGNTCEEDVREAATAAWNRVAKSAICEYRLSTEQPYMDTIEERFTNYIAYLEALANYRYDYPQVDLVGVKFHDANVHGDEKCAPTMHGRALQGLIMATIELIKCTIANCAAFAASPVSTMIILFRCVNAHALYKIGGQVLTSLINLIVHRLLQVLHDANQSSLERSGNSSITSLQSISAGSDTFKSTRNISDSEFEALTPRQKLALLAREWHVTLYQFSRTSEQLRVQCQNVQRTLRVEDVNQEWLHVLPPESFAMMKGHGSLHPSSSTCPWCGSEEDTPQCHPEGSRHVPPCAVHLVDAWKQQVKNVRALFVQKGEQKGAPQVLNTLEQLLEDAEKEYKSVDTSRVSAGVTSAPPSSEFQTCVLTNTFLVRKSVKRSFDSSSSSKKEVEMEVMYLDQMMDHTTNSIDTLLQQDDVVVVCQDDFSAADKLKLADRFVVLRERPLGEGSYGKVFRAWDELRCCYLAAKEMPLDNSKETPAALHDALHEYTVLTQLQHPNIVSVKAFMVAGSVGTIFMEWMPSGSLQQVLRSSPRQCLREPVVARYMRDALRGLEYLHSRDIMHRDVKPANMLLGTDGSVKLTDFGTSFVMAEGGRTVESGAITGTAPYMAPEYARGFQSRAGDIWSLGCTAVELLSGLVPWSDPVTGARPEMLPLVFRIGSLDDRKNTERPHTLLWDKMVERAGNAGLSSELRSFLDAIFVVDRHARPTATQLLKHPFILKLVTLKREENDII